MQEHLGKLRKGAFSSKGRPQGSIHRSNVLVFLQGALGNCKLGPRTASGFWGRVLGLWQEGRGGTSGRTAALGLRAEGSGVTAAYFVAGKADAGKEEGQWGARSVS